MNIAKNFGEKARFVAIAALITGMITQFEGSKILRENPKLDIEYHSPKAHRVSGPHDMPWKIKDEPIRELEKLGVTLATSRNCPEVEKRQLG